MLKCEIEIEVHRLKRFEKGFFQVGSNRTFKEAPVVLLEPDTFPTKRVANSTFPASFYIESSDPTYHTQRSPELHYN
jgi:hypothetical protein